MTGWKTCYETVEASYDGVIASYDELEASQASLGASHHAPGAGDDALEASSEAVMSGCDTLEAVFHRSDISSRVLDAGRLAAASPHPGSLTWPGLPGVVHAPPAAGPAGNRASTVPS